MSPIRSRPNAPALRPTITARPANGARHRVGRRATLLAIAGALVVAGPAAAHPFVRGGELPVDSLSTMTLAMAHGCGSETSDGGDPTTDVSIEVPAWLRIVDVAEETGWSIELEEGDGGVVEVVTWTADGAEQTAPDFDLEVVATGEPGEELFLRVFQACDEFVYRWVGTPDEPADDPAIGVTLVEADPDAPPPSEPADEPEPEPEPEAEAEPVEEPGSEPADEPETEAGGLPGWFVPVTVVVLLGAIGAVVLGRRGRSEG